MLSAAQLLRGVTGAPEAPPPGPTIDANEFVTTERLARDTRTLMASLPEDIDLVVGISRSGLLPGSLIAYHLHVPLLTVSRQTGLHDPGHGIRLESREARPPRHVLLIDDTAARGGEMRANAPAVRAAFPDARLTRAVVYCHPQAVGEVDRFAFLYPGIHYLEWNWCNAGHGAACGYDFDGILVRDDDPEQRPLYLPRRTPVPLVCTGRHESARGQTQAWLDRWGVRCERLVMRDWGDPLEFDITRIAEFKARHYAEAGLSLFAESDPEQARIIADVSGKPVLCPQLGRVIPARSIPAAQLALVNACEHRGCKTGCGHAWCKRHLAEKHIDECAECVSRAGLMRATAGAARGGSLSPSSRPWPSPRSS